MKKSTGLGSVAATALLTCAASAPSSAAVWDFYGLAGGPARTLGSSYVFSQGGEQVFAEAVSPGGTPGTWHVSTQTMKNCIKNKATKANPCLWSKGPKPADERGLGLIPNPDKEVFFRDGIEFTAYGQTVTDILLGSLQKNESWQIQGCGKTGPCSVIASGLGNASGELNVTSGLGHWYSYVVDVPCPPKDLVCLGGKTNSDNNILLMSITTRPSIPEPATLSLLALGLAGVGLARRRQKR